MVGAADGAGDGAVGFGEFGAAVSAGVDHAVKSAVDVPGNEDGASGDLADEQPSGFSDFGGGADAHPGALEHASTLDLERFLVGVEIGGETHCLGDRASGAHHASSVVQSVAVMSPSPLGWPRVQMATASAVSSRSAGEPADGEDLRRAAVGRGDHSPAPRCSRPRGRRRRGYGPPRASMTSLFPHGAVKTPRLCCMR